MIHFSDASDWGEPLKAHEAFVSLAEVTGVFDCLCERFTLLRMWSVYVFPKILN